LPSTQEALRIVGRIRSTNSHCRIRIDISQLAAFKLPICFVTLYDADTIDPQKRYVERSRGYYSIAECCWKILKGKASSMGFKILSSGKKISTCPPAMTQCDILVGACRTWIKQFELISPYVDDPFWQPFPAYCTSRVIFLAGIYPMRELAPGALWKWVAGDFVSIEAVGRNAI
jgi:hypothetical protein